MLKNEGEPFSSTRTENQLGGLTRFPIYGFHRSVYEFEDDTATLVESFRDGAFSNLHAWDSGTISAIRAWRPRVLLIDSVLPRSPIDDEAIREVYYLSPEDPFTMRWDNKDSFIVGGDIPYEFNCGDPEVERALRAKICDNYAADVPLLGLMTPEMKRVIDLRNAVFAIKLAEAEAAIPRMERQDGPSIVLVGNGHEYGNTPTVWEDSQVQKQIIENAVVDILNDISIENRGIAYQDLINFFARINIWRIKGPCSSQEVEEVKKLLVLDSSTLSPTIVEIIAKLLDGNKEAGLEPNQG